MKIQMKTLVFPWLCGWLATGTSSALEVDFSPPAPPKAIALANGKATAEIIYETSNCPAVQHAVNELADDFQRVTGTRPPIKNRFSNNASTAIINGTFGKNDAIDRLAAAGKLATNGIAGTWESFTLQIFANPGPELNVLSSSPAATRAERFMAFINFRN